MRQRKDAVSSVFLRANMISNSTAAAAAAAIFDDRTHIETFEKYA